MDGATHSDRNGGWFRMERYLGRTWHLLACIPAALLLFAGNAQAVPVSYQLNVNLDRVGILDSQGGLSPCPVEVHCPSLGTHTGTFSLDSSALAQNGVFQVVPLAFRFEIAATVWDTANRGPLFDGARLYDLSGFRSGFGLGQEWTIRVEDGELTGLCCGVYGAADSPWMDLYGGPPSEL